MIPSFAFNTTASIQFGNGFLSRLGDLARTRMGGRVLLVTDPGLVSTGIVARAEQSLRDAAVDFVTLPRSRRTHPRPSSCGRWQRPRRPVPWA